MQTITVATRKSELALGQCRAFIRQLVEKNPGLAVKELHVVTTGDKVQDRPLSEIGGKGLFLKEIEEALLAGEAEIAVHSMKDVPRELHPGLVIGCIPAREDPRDALISRDGVTLSALPQGARLGTSSLRRRVQILRARPDLIVVPIRGNVGTRIRKCREGDVDATILALAGLNRLAMAGEASEILSPELCLPAVGQGALAIEMREGDDSIARILAPLVNQEVTWLTAAERGVMRAVEGDCKTPVASFAEREGADLRLRAFLSEEDGSRQRTHDVRVPFPSSEAEARELGESVGNRLKRG